MRPLEERLADVKAKLDKELNRCEVNEETVDKYRALLKQKFENKS